jgi:hypothetical protein
MEVSLPRLESTLFQKTGSNNIVSLKAINILQEKSLLLSDTQSLLS